MSSCNSQLVHQVMHEVATLVPGIDQRQLMTRISGVIAMYEVKEIHDFAYQPDIKDKIGLYIAAKKIEGLSPKTIAEYKLKLYDFAKKCNKLVSDITTNDIRQYLGEYYEVNMASTLDTKLSVLKSFFGWLVDEEIITKDPAKKLKPIKGETRLRKALTIEELEIVRESCTNPRDRALVEFLYATGCRLDEVVGLKKSDINFDTLSLKVIGKGNKERVVYISAKTKIHLKKYFAWRKDDTDYLFTTERKPYRPLQHRSIQKIVGDIGEHAGISKKLHPHLFRHTLATLMLNNGADIVTVQNILGHENIGTTEHYAKMSKENVQIEYRKHLVV